MEFTIGRNIQRKEAWDKVTGVAKYTNDEQTIGILHAKLVTSTYAHAKIKSINVNKAYKLDGVLAVIIGKDYNFLTGSSIYDRPILAVDKVRYYGEPVAIVVAYSEMIAKKGANLIEVEYEELPVVNTIEQALDKNSILVHKDLGKYKKVIEDVYPEANTNIANRCKIRKGDMNVGWSCSDVVVEMDFRLPQSDHMAMETRTSQAQIHPNGDVVIITSSQGPFDVKKEINTYFGVDESKVIVKTPLLGGAFGGKAAVQLELLAYIASKAVDGRRVKIVNTREEDISASPCHAGFKAKVKLGARKDGTLQAAELTYIMDSGAYANSATRMAQSAASSCTGPYHIDNVWCDSLCVYTNHTYATSFRGFGHQSFTFCIERTMDKLAQTLGIDPIDLRYKNAILPGQSSPTQVKISWSNTGNLQECIIKLKDLIRWNEGQVIDIGNNKVRAKGISCFWKTSNSPSDAVSGVLLTFNSDGSININCGAIECGPGTKTMIAQIVAEKMNMNIDDVNIKFDVDTQTAPKTWKTVASMTIQMVGSAALRACEDVIKQLKDAAGIVLRCSPEDLDIVNKKVYVRHEPNIYVDFKYLVYGIKLPGGNSIGGQILGRGSYIVRHIAPLNPENGIGKPGPAWTLGAQAVEVEFDTIECTYRLIKAATVIDVGRIINPKLVRSQILGGMCMGLGLGTREAFEYTDKGILLDTSLRSYKVMHLGEQPDYLVDYVETPQIDAPYGVRGFEEHGILGIPSALANALTAASGIDLNQLPITPEYIWMLKTGGKI